MVSAVFHLVPSVERARLLAALGLDDDGSPTFELARAETGASALLVDDALHVPLLRSPTSARDLIPSVSAATSSLGSWRCIGRPSDEPALSSWDALHLEACRSAALAASLPHMPLEALERLHGWLLAVARTPSAAGPVLALFDVDSDTTNACVTLPARAALIAPVPLVLVELDGVLTQHSLERVRALGTARDDGFVSIDATVHDALGPGEPIAESARIVSPVEVVDDESL